MRYATGRAFRAALEQRLLSDSRESGVSLDRLRRRVLLERVLARLVAIEPGQWVLKGGMALEVRLGNRARLTKDVDLGLRDDDGRASQLHERLSEIVAADVGGDHFAMSAEQPKELRPDGGGHLTWRFKVNARLGDKPFGRLQLDVSPRAHELNATDVVTIPGLLTFAGLPAPRVEIVDVHRHAAEKFHAMARDLGERENTRVRDLVDIVTLHEHGLIDPVKVAAAARQVWNERDATAPPTTFPPLPPSWSTRYPQLVTDHPLSAATFSEASDLAARFWQQMFPSKES